MFIDRKISVLICALAATGCVNLAPAYEQPIPPVAAQLPTENDPQIIESLINWDTVFTSPELVALMKQALIQNRNLRVSTANIEIARAQYGVSLTGRLPTVAVSASAQEGGRVDTSGVNSSTFRDSAIAQIGVSGYELDFFGRVRNSTDAALNTYLSTEEGARAARISILASVAEIWIQLATDRALLKLAEDTVDVQSDSLNLTRELFNAGAATELDTRRASASVETARAQAAQYEAQIRQDISALRLVVGGEIPTSAHLAARLSPSPVSLDIAIGTNSDVLLNRPDILAAERTLRAANANIGVARAALFPSITLSGNLGYSSTDLENLFSSDTAGWTFGPQLNLPIFDHGARLNQIKVSEARQELALAQYELTIQTAFREAADAMAVSETIDRRLRALEQLTEDGDVTLDLSLERFRVGVDDYLSVLDAQRQDYSSRQQLILARRDRALNSVAVYRAFGAPPEVAAEPAG